MKDHECIQCNKAIGENTVCLDCTFSNVETVMKEWGWSKLSFDGQEIKITTKGKQQSESKVDRP